MCCGQAKANYSWKDERSSWVFTDKHYPERVWQIGFRRGRKVQNQRSLAQLKDRYIGGTIISQRLSTSHQFGYDLHRFFAEIPECRDTAHLTSRSNVSPQRQHLKVSPVMKLMETIQDLDRQMNTEKLLPIFFICAKRVNFAVTLKN